MPPEARFAVVASTGAFDFMPAFEDAILCIVPSALFLVVSLQRLFWLARQPRKVAKSHRPIGLIGVYTALQLAVLVYWALNAEKWPFSRLRTSAAVLAFVDGFLLLFLSHAEHARSVRPSTIINVYLLFTLLFDSVIARTLWLSDHDSIISGLFTSTVAIKLFVLTSEAWEKRPILLSQYQDLSPEATSGILARSVFWWLNSLMRTGFARSLTDHDLFPIHDSLAARTLLPKARSSFGASNQSSRHALAFSTLWATKYIFLAGVAPRLALAAFKYTLPFLITRTTSWTADPSQPDSIGWRLTGAWLLVFLGQAISNCFYYQMTYRFVTSIRGSLCSLIYTKTLDLRSTALDGSVAVSLMSTDTESICQSAATLHELWASPIESAVAIFLLYRQLGLAALAPVVVAIIATAGMFQLARFIGMAKKRWKRGIQTRVDVTASVLTSMKEVKMLGLSDIVANMIQNLRVTELDLSKQYRRLLAIQTFIAMNTATIAPLATFATFVVVSKSTGQPLNTGSAYTSLSLIYLLSDPMVVVFRTIPFVSAALACFSRIQTYLLSESCTDYKLPLSERDHHPSQDNEKGDTLVAISGASLGWVPGKPDILNDITVDIRRSCFTFVVGPVGSGKSILIRALLGEVPLRAGSIHADPGNIAFVSQEPWIQNLTIRHNILGSASYDAEWYDKVVYACGLEQDINELPDGDATRAGSAGFSLSGGQKQRLALARAVYSREKTVLLDDVFAGQDAATEEHTFQNLFAETGLFRQMSITMVCVTNAIHRLAYADHVVALWISGHIVHQGSFAQLQSDTDYLHGLAVEQNGAIDTQDAACAWCSIATRLFLGADMNKMLNRTATTLNRPDESSANTAEGSGQATNDYYLGLFAMLTGLAVLGITGAAYFFLVVMVASSSEVLHALAFFSRTDVGVTTNRFSQDMSVILMCVFSGYFAAALVPFVAFCWLLQKFYVRTSRQIRLFDLEAKSPLFTQFLDLLQGLSTVRAFAWGPRFIDQYLELLDASQRPFYLLFCIQRWLGLVLDLLTAVLVTVMMVLVVKLRAQLSAQTGRGVKTFCTDTESENRPTETGTVPWNWPPHGRVTIKDLVASYDGGEPVLRGVSLDIPAGAKVGICGRSGSGKSSLLGCILRLLEVGPGSHITIDGVDITTLPRQVPPRQPYRPSSTAEQTGAANRRRRSERLIRDVMREQFASCTVIAVAHRLGAVVDFDRVAVMGGGRLLEWDNPRALLKRDSEFKRFWDLGAG
ncbi:ABC transporter integral membrane type 1 [Penicillium psychrosexuale]|uniref:ABC transporter integral membrane type 1 n=1 Tax=Penicillium psychrosexuale TaxID=1002107 RepID=UPI0025456856|nr:ABC transporter integral membrane type 1 [Penicillium psychrosexuale]KAJ5790163.1 ABC transporter integral membrane type 1 [Penicillium psychrosexuale]